MRVKTTTIAAQEEILSQIVKKEMSLLRPQRRGLITWKTVPCLNYNQAQISGTREVFFSHETIYHKTQKQTEWWKCALIVMRQYYKHHWKTVLNLINNSLINCAGTNSSNFTMILNFYHSKLHSFQNPKNRFFRVSFLCYPKPGFLNFALNWKH